MLTLRQHSAALTAALLPLYEAREAEAIASQVLEHLLQLTPLQRRLQANEVIPTERLASLPAVQARLLRHEPLQYVLGQAHFADLTLEVTPATLIPRPETEELVALIAQDATGRAGLRVLDVGTGTGCIPLALAARLPGAHFTAVDVSGAALAVARRNAERHHVVIDFQEVDILTQVPRLAAPADVLVSNPPYVLEQERALMRPNVLAYEPATALFVPNHDPLRFYRRLAALGPTLLAPGGWLYFEINEQFAAETLALLHAHGYQQAQALDDLFGRPRFTRACWPGPAAGANC